MLIRVSSGLWLLLGPAAVYAQAGGQAQSNVPVLASGQMPTALPSGYQKLTNVFQGSIAVGAQFDDNVVLGSPSSQSDITYNVSPSLSFTQTNPRFNWGLSYGPGVGISQHRLYQDQMTQSFGGHFSWRVSKRSTLSAEQGYSRSTNPFAQYGAPGFATTPGPTVSPNETIYLPNIRRTSIFSHALYSDELGEHSMFGLGGSFASDHFDSTPNSGSAASLINSQTVSGEAYLSHQFTARNEFGFQYGAQILKFTSTNARTTTHSFLLFDQVNFTSHSNLTLYGGPEYSLISNQVQLNLGFVLITIPVKTNQWTGSGGAIYHWTGRRAAAVLDYSRRVSNGGGLIGAVELDSGSASLSWRLSPRWSLTSGIAVADDQLLAVQSGANDARTYSANLGFGRQISRDVGVQIFYERLNQTGSLAGFAAGNHDIAGASLSYTFLRPLGR